MTISVGTSSDSGPTGLAGRLATAIKAAFAGTTYPAGGIGVKGVDSLCQGIVDALNNDKVSAATQVAGKIASASAADQLGEPDTRAVNDLPADSVLTKQAITCAFKSGSTIGLPLAFYMVVTFAPWTDDSGGGVHQLAFGSSATATTPAIAWREGSIQSNTWGAWQKIDLASLVTATGDLLYASGAAAMTRLGVGNAGDLLTVVSGLPAWLAAARAYAASESITPGTTSGVAGNNAWVDIVGASVSFTPKSTTRQIRVSLRMSGYDGGGTGNINFRIVFGAGPTQAGSTKVFFFNASVSGTNVAHLTQTFEWTLAAATLGAVGTPVTVKAQLQSPTGSTATYTQDTNDHTDFSVEEVG